MAIPLLVITLFSHIILICSATHVQLSPSSAQIKFWSENVQNKMPNPVMKKLSPLSKENCDLFTTIISKNGNKFTADSNFCSLAKLACTSSFNSSLNNFRSFYLGRASYAKTATNANAIAKPNEDPFAFFRLSILKVGDLVHLSNLEDPFPYRTFLPSQFASQISLASANEITKIFPQSAFGVTKETIESTICICNFAPINGEQKLCTKSLEEMVSFSKSALGGKTKLLALTSVNTKGYSNAELIIKKMKRFNGDKFVACHEVYLPFASYYCHSVDSSRLYQVDFVDPKTGAPANTMLALCHMDTSAFSADHIALQILKIRPGEGEACHWFLETDLAWINADNAN